MEEEIGIHIGDVVQLKSGGPKMTVLKIEVDNGGLEEELVSYKVQCIWYGEGQRYHEAPFIHFVLMIAE
jgi:uncharacterized protein YodC (DUF2158 family)